MKDLVHGTPLCAQRRVDAVQCIWGDLFLPHLAETEGEVLQNVLSSLSDKPNEIFSADDGTHQ